MDQDTLVKTAEALVKGLEANAIVVRGAMWVRLEETNGWRLWIVSSKDADKKQFYQAVAKALPDVEQLHTDFSISDVELKQDSDPVIKALALFIRAEGFNSINMSRNMVNGVYTPDGILLRMAL